MAEKFCMKYKNVRPLVFLCGPNMGENTRSDRRYILKNEIESFPIINGDGKSFPFPLIIDNVIQDEEVKKNANFTLIEELISLCSLKTYFLLDTMSTSYELGLFNNSYANNKICVFLPNDYKENSINQIGDFIEISLEKTLGKVKKIMYSCVRDERKFLYFDKDVIPLEINEVLEDDFFDCEQQLTEEYHFIYTNKKSDIETSESGNTFVYCDDNYIDIIISLNLLFIYVNKYHKLEVNKIIEKVINETINLFFIENAPYNVELNLIYIKFINKKLKITMNTKLHNTLEEIVSNMKYFIEAIHRRNTPQKYKNIEYHELKLLHKYKINTVNLLSLTYNQRKIIREFKNNPKKYTEKHNIKIKNKNRCLVTYKNNKKGYELRKIHDQISLIIQDAFKFNESSFAYTKQKSTIDCCKEHIENNYFLKIDISNFFESINKNTLKKIIKCQLTNNPHETFDNIFNKRKKTIYKSDYIYSLKEIQIITDAAFYNSKMPLGFSLSPVLSNLFLNLFDFNFFKKYPYLTYTRYADDIMISSAQEFNFDAVGKYIENELEKLNLKVNTQKTRIYRLMKPGDHVKYLGINIVHTNHSNILTVGNKMIKDVSKEIQNCDLDDYVKIAELKGKLRYIKYVNAVDYTKLKKLYRIKTLTEIPSIFL